MYTDNRGKQFVYLDNAATTKPYSYNTKYWFNSNSVYLPAVNTNIEIEFCRRQIKERLNLKSGKIIFGYNASQIINYLSYNFGDGLRICSPFEHNCVKEICDFVVYNEKSLEVLVEPKSYVFQMYVNNITGQIFDIESLGKITREYGGYFISDVTAAIGKVKLPDNLEEYCDCIFCSAHKFHGPRSMGFAWVSDRLLNQMFGNKIDNLDMFLGTKPSQEIIDMSYAFLNNHAGLRIEANEKGYDYLIRLLKEELKDAGIKSMLVAPKNKTSAINTLYLPKIDANSLVQYLSSKNIYISAAHSACDYNKDKHNNVLLNYGFNEKESEQCIRVSFCRDNNEYDVKQLVEEIKEFKKLFI